MMNEKRANERMIELLESRAKELEETCAFWKKVWGEHPGDNVYKTQYHETLKSWAEIQKVLISFYKICEEETMPDTRQEMWG